VRSVGRLGLRGKVGDGGFGSVEVGDVGLVVLGVVELHDVLDDVGFEGLRGWQGGFMLVYGFDHSAAKRGIVLPTLDSHRKRKEAPAKCVDLGRTW
jgi:hypothetical protein